MRLISTIWFWLVLALTFPPGYVIALVILWATPNDKHRHTLQRFLNFYCHDYIATWPGWKVTVEGGEKLPSGPCVMVSNHQSLSDILALMGLPKLFHFVSKAELFKVPLVGFMMKKLGHVSLERGKQGSTQQMMADCDALLTDGESVLIFPEGTYAPEPKRLTFRRGAFFLAVKHQVPLVLVLLEGTSTLVKEDGPWFAPRANVRIRVMEVATPAAGSDDGVLAKEVEAKFRRWLGSP